MALQTTHEGPPYGRDNNVFFAASPAADGKIELTGPGVGVISTFTRGRCGVMDGTSMSCAAVTGAVARLLSLGQNADIRRMEPSEERSAKIAGLAFQAAEKLKLGATYEGYGLIR